MILVDISAGLGAFRIVSILAVAACGPAASTLYPRYSTADCKK